MLKKISASLILAILSNIVALLFLTLAVLNYDSNSYSDYLFSILLITSGIGLFQYDISARLSKNYSNKVNFGIISVYKSLKLNFSLFLPYGLALLIYFAYQDLKISIFILVFSPLFIANQIFKNYLSINKKIYLVSAVELTHRIIFLTLIYIIFYVNKYKGDELKFLPYLIFFLQHAIEFLFLGYNMFKLLKENKSYDNLDDINYINTLLFIRNNFLGVFSNIAINYTIKELFLATTYIQYNYSLQFYNGLKIVSNIFSSFNWLNLISISNSGSNYFISKLYNNYLLLFSIFLYPLFYIFYYQLNYFINGNPSYSKIPIFIIIMYVGWLLNELGKRQVAYFFSNEDRLKNYYGAILKRDIFSIFLILIVLNYNVDIISVLILLHVLPVVFLRAYIYLMCSSVKPRINLYEVFTIFTILIIILIIL